MIFTLLTADCLRPKGLLVSAGLVSAGFDSSGLESCVVVSGCVTVSCVLGSGVFSVSVAGSREGFSTGLTSSF